MSARSLISNLSATFPNADVSMSVGENGKTSGRERLVDRLTKRLGTLESFAMVVPVVRTQQTAPKHTEDQP